MDMHRAIRTVLLLILILKKDERQILEKNRHQNDWTIIILRCGEV